MIATGLLLLAVGVLVRFAPWTVSWFGNLPGDIRIESAGGRTFIPITSMIIVSVVGSAVLSLVVKLFRSG